MDEVTYFAVGDVAAHEGWIAEMRGPAWPAENGWTEQDAKGAHGTILDEYASREEAQAKVDEFERCDAHEQGTYCYAHNPVPCAHR